MSARVRHAAEAAARATEARVLAEHRWKTSEETGRPLDLLLADVLAKREREVGAIRHYRLVQAREQRRRV